MAVARLPQVASISTEVLYNAALPVHRGQPVTVVQTFSSPDRALGASADRVKILQGRMFRPAAIGQAVIGPQLAVPAVLVLANVIAAGPGWTAVRIRPAPVLRSE